MADRLLTEATGSLNSKLTEINKVMTDTVLDESASKQNDDHLKVDVEGIRKALRGNYKEAANILLTENEYVKNNPDLRKDNNGLIAMANTLCGVSLLKMGKFDEAEKLLQSERILNLTGQNKQFHTKDLNSRALKVALLKQGRVEEAKYMELTDQVSNIGHGFTDKSLTEIIQGLDKRLTKNAAEMDRMQKEMLSTFSSERREQLMKDQTYKHYSINADKISKMETEGMMAVLQRNNEKGAAYLKNVFDVVDADDRLRQPGVRDQSKVQQVDPEHTEIASSLYGYSLLELGHYPEAEKRFRKEVERDLANLNTGKLKQLNQIGLEFALMKQGKHQEASQIENTADVMHVQPLKTLQPLTR